MAKGDRRQQILEALAQQLEAHPGGKVTTARLASAVGVSEAALYRHFPSKARMFEGLIDFAEESVFSRINRIMEEERHTDQRIARILYLLLAFAQRNPGIVRVILGDALLGEKLRLYDRIDDFFKRLQTQLRQILRESRLREDVALRTSPEGAADMLVVYTEGQMHKYLRSRFQVVPLANWEQDWAVLSNGLFN